MPGGTSEGLRSNSRGVCPLHDEVVNSIRKAVDDHIKACEDNEKSVWKKLDHLENNCIRSLSIDVKSLEKDTKALLKDMSNRKADARALRRTIIAFIVTQGAILLSWVVVSIIKLKMSV